VRLPVMGLVVANKYKGQIKSIADLKGRPLGVTSPGSQTHMILGYLLAKSGVKASDVKIMGAGGSTMPLAIEMDSVHAGMMLDPFFTVFLKQGKGFALVDMFTSKGTHDAMGGEVQGTTLLTRPDVIAKRPGTVQKMVNALVRANKLIVQSSGEELAKTLPKELAGDLKLYAESFEHAKEAFPPDSLVSRDGVARVIETMRVFEAVPADMKIEPESVFDNRYVLKALGR
jgi:NitT/TauT family transport system substrate-binding protein